MRQSILLVLNFLLAGVIYYFAHDRTLSIQGILYVWTVGLLILLLVFYAFYKQSPSERVMALSLTFIVLWYISFTQTIDFRDTVFALLILSVLMFGYLEPSIFSCQQEGK
jgi:hypothetical protein